MMEEWLPLVHVALLLVVALLLLVVEFFLVSFGLLGIASLVSAATAIYLAARWDPLAGYLTALLVVILALVTVRWGFRHLSRSGLVPKTAIDEHAGYQHVADRFAIAVGSTGVLMTPARPGGRARFAGGDCDVQSVSGVLAASTPVQVERIDGPVIYVTNIHSQE